MTLKELFIALQDVDIYEVYLWLEWYASKEKTCKECVLIYQAAKIPPPCYKCTPVRNLLRNKNSKTLKKELQNVKTIKR